METIEEIAVCEIKLLIQDVGLLGGEYHECLKCDGKRINCRDYVPNYDTKTISITHKE